ncbi:hypothetical protein GFB49_13825 [Epibacterium sp. SM1979]|uniref:Uncharacterized protein n=1 Tax=Tritonibacter litoralis TaxID=2662264 RepID=A0A843YJV8_9RHOB|nr:hypothetical protein [Tritonibacter litoralis]MQQ09542.1 hypothetical protein [Tritonibacter litoralis]
MDLWTMLAACYVCTAGFAVIMTRREQIAHGGISPLKEAVGLGLSVLWPLAVGLILGAILWQKLRVGLSARKLA